MPDDNENPEKPHPYQIVLDAFEYFKMTKNLDELDLGSLINICIAAGCPNSDVAQGVLNAMVMDQILTFRKTKDQVLFRVRKGKVH